MISVIRFFNYFEKKSLLSLTIEYGMVLYIQQLRKTETTNGGKQMEFLLVLIATLAILVGLAVIAVGWFVLCWSVSFVLAAVEGWLINRREV